MAKRKTDYSIVKLKRIWSDIESAMDHAHYISNRMIIPKLLIIRVEYPTGIEFQILKPEELPFSNYSNSVQAIIEPSIKTYRSKL